MKYMLAIYANQQTWDAFPADEWPAAIAKQDAFNQRYFATGELIGAYGLADASGACTVRVREGQAAVTDGPYLETKEYLASYYLLDVADHERALAIAAELPWASVGAAELWPVQHVATPS